MLFIINAFNVNFNARLPFIFVKYWINVIYASSCYIELIIVHRKNYIYDKVNVRLYFSLYSKTTLVFNEKKECDGNI